MTSLRWNIYTAQVLFVETDTTKLRPVVALSEAFGEYKIVMVAPLYSIKPNHRLAGDVKISESYSNLGLIKPSTIRLHRMVSLPASDLKEQLGRVSLPIQNAIKVELKKLFEL